MRRLVLGIVLVGCIGALTAGCGGGGSGSSSAAPSTNDGATIPRVLDATAPSIHYVEVTFADPAGSAAERPQTYVITDPDGTRLAVSDVQLDAMRAVATLVTAAQQPVRYTLALVGAAPPAVGAPTPLEVAFMGSSIAEGQLKSGSAVDNTHVVLVFIQQGRGPRHGGSARKLSDPGPELGH